MEWYNILSLVLGSGGITTAIIAIYTAKPKKDKIDIENYHSLLEEERKERELVRQEFREYKEEVARYKQFFKEKFDELRNKNERLEDAINQGYKCPLIEKISDCVIIRAIEECKECETK